MKAKKLRKPRQIVIKESAALEVEGGCIFITPAFPQMIVLYDKEARKMAEWLNRAADWAEQQEKQINGKDKSLVSRWLL